jgi:hypothetical protein
MPRFLDIGNRAENHEYKEKKPNGGKNGCSQNARLGNALHRAEAPVARHVIPQGDVRTASLEAAKVGEVPGEGGADFDPDSITADSVGRESPQSQNPSLKG